MKQQLEAAAERLRQAGVASPEHDARALAMHVVGVQRPSELALHDTLDTQRYDDLVARRARRVPLQHLTGTAPFRWVELSVGPGVFIPRPETESVVEQGISMIQSLEGPVVVDLCTGSGAIALSIATEVAGSVVHAVELSPDALPWARRNLTDRVALHHADIEGCLPELDGLVDLVISNPPYVPLGTRDLMEPEVVDHDPAIAVFGGEDGLEVIRQVEVAARRLLRPGGAVVVEHDDTHGASAPALFGSAWSDVADHDDLSGRPRFLSARLCG